MPKVGKPKSKRVPVRLRHKIEKASAAKQRKDRKLAKKNPQWRSKLKKDPGIPNLFPYKDRILEQIEEQKLQKQEELERKRAEARAKKISIAQDQQNLDREHDSPDDIVSDDDAEENMEIEGDASNPMAALLASARARAAEYEEQPQSSEDEDEDDEDTVLTDARVEQSARSYAHLFETVLTSADIILYVLDARDPTSTRSTSIERQISAFASGTKRVLLVLNKIDLVPPQVLKGWLTYLRRYHPTLPLRASSPASNAKVFDHKSLTQKATAETLLQALKAYATEQNLKRAITVGVVGYPNVGKSSVINALASCLGRRKAPAPTGAEAGVTTVLKSIKLDNKVTLLDSPGVVFPEKTNDAQTFSGRQSEDLQARLVLLNALPPKSINDPIPAISLLLTRLSENPTSMSGLLQHYGLVELMSGISGDRTMDFLVQVARKRGRLGKGGVPNLESAAMCVLQDWRDGRISGWTEPPLALAGSARDGQAQNGGKTTSTTFETDEKQIVTEWAAEFKIDGLWDSSRYERIEDTMET